METISQPSLLFVYNADSSLFSVASDYVHKIVSPETYQCNLCKLTYGNLGMQKQWTEFLRMLPYPTRFLHRDEFRAAIPALNHTKLPALFIVRDNMPTLALSADRINQAQKIDDLVSMVRDVMKTTNL